MRGSRLLAGSAVCLLASLLVQGQGGGPLTSPPATSSASPTTSSSSPQTTFPVTSKPALTSATYPYGNVKGCVGQNELTQLGFPSLAVGALVHLVFHSKARDAANKTLLQAICASLVPNATVARPEALMRFSKGDPLSTKEFASFNDKCDARQLLASGTGHTRCQQCGQREAVSYPAAVFDTLALREEGAMICADGVPVSLDFGDLVAAPPLSPEPTSWPAWLMFIVVVMSIVCLERFYTSCRIAYRRRQGKEGFDRLPVNQRMDGPIDVEDGPFSVDDEEMTEMASSRH